MLLMVKMFQLMECLHISLQGIISSLLICIWASNTIKLTWLPTQIQILHGKKRSICSPEHKWTTKDVYLNRHDNYSDLLRSRVKHEWKFTKDTIFWDVMLCGLLEVYSNFKATYISIFKAECGMQRSNKQALLCLLEHYVASVPRRQYSSWSLM